MASDLSSGCELSREGVDLADEKEEGEISLEDVSSSEEGQPTYGYRTKGTQCPNCPPGQACGARCTVPKKFTVPIHQHRNQPRKDAAHGKENLHYIREPSYTGGKHTISTLQEKNDDLVPISSDSDMEIVGLLDNSVQLAISVKSKAKTKKKKKKKRNHTSGLTMDDLESSSSIDVTERLQNCLDPVKHEENLAKGSVMRTHRRNFSPVHKSSRTRPVPRTPPRRHKSPARSRSPYRRSRSPLIPRPRSPLSRRSPRRQKSPKRSPRRSPIKSLGRKQSHFDGSNGNVEHPTSHANVQKLLKKVRELDAVGTHSLEETLNKNKEHASSLKEKLLHMMKAAPDNNTNQANIPKEKVELAPAKESNDGDDEEDLAMLRQKALETKQKKAAARNDPTETEAKSKTLININDDQDEEDLQLRMIALRSAVLKKHRNRVQRGVNAGKNKKVPRSESPFTQSFLDSIPIPGEELLNFASPPHTPPPMSEISHTEDMDLDTDVEREKEKLPYSPTDKITSDIPIDTEMLGIQPSDVSFISLTESANNQSIGFTPQIVQNRSYLPSTYSHGKSLDEPYNIISNNNINERNSKLTEHGDLEVANSGNQQMPYSPTDTPICDTEIPHTTSEAPGYPRTLINCSALSELSGYDQLQCTENLIMSNQQFRKNLNNKFDDQHLVEQISGSGTNSLVGSPSPASLITIDDLPESDIDLPSSAGSLKCDIRNEEHIPNSISSNSNVRNVEPLYMQGVPDVSKDSNKIPTLINRTLVPAPILKSNKQLQKPLPIKKPEVPSEPSFKSAEMQPVEIDKVKTTDSTSVFKPMKLPASVQKIATLVKPPIAFHDQLQDDFESESQCNRKTSALKIKATDQVENHKEVQNDTHVNKPVVVQSDETRTHRKGKTPKKGVKRKSSSSIEILEVKNSDSNRKGSKQSKPLTNKSIHTTSKTSVSKDTILNTNALEKSEEITVKSNENIIVDDVLTPTNSTNMQNCSNVNTKNAPASDESVEMEKNVRSRRQSLDEDEDALRAILLASLPKRAKASDNVTSNSSPVRITSAAFNVELKQTTTITKVECESPQSTTSHMENNKNLLTTANKIVAQNCVVIEAGVNDQMKENDVSTTANTGAVTQKPIPTMSGKKRPILPNKGPHRKIIKRPPISASTKVVNNAKKYQNAILQKKLNLQKAASVYSNHKLTDHQAMNKIQSNDGKWAVTGKKNSIAEPQRIVINLQSDTESDSDIEREKNNIGRPSAASNVTDKAHPNPNCTTEFEKNLEQFLRAARKKHESVSAAKTAPQTPVLNKNIQMEKQSATNLRTPLAVRHLPASQQAEYRRLKQQILEREKLKMRRAAEMKGSKGTILNTGSSSSETNQQHQKEKENNLIGSVAAKVPLSSSKPLSPGSKQNKSPTIPMTNLSIRISNENIPQTPAVNRTISTLSPVRTVTESVNGITPIPQEALIHKAHPVLRVLTGAEINRKYVQIQVKHDTNERIVTINEQSSQKESTISATSRTEKSAAGDDNSINLTDPVLKNTAPENDQSTQSGLVDSDASTIVLRKDNQAESTRDSITSNQSTIIISQQTEQNQVNSKQKSDSRVPNNSAKGSVKISNEKRATAEGWDTAKKEVKETINALRELSPVTQTQHLKSTEQKLVMKRYAILDELSEMSGNLRQWHMERDLQTLLIVEVKKLREQLRVAEERLQVQRDHIKTIGPKVVAAHKKINAGRQECFKLSKICSALGIKVIGKKYKIPDAGAHLLEVRLKEVANHTRQLSRKRESATDGSTTPNSETMDSSPGRLCETSTESSQPPEKNLQTDKTVDCPEKVPLPHEEDKCCSATELRNSEELQFDDAISESLEIVRETTDSVVNDSPPQTREENSIEQDNTIVYVQPEGSSTPITSKTKKHVQTPEITTDNNTAIPPKSTGMTTSLNKMDEQHSKRGIAPYVSILTHMKVARNANPNGVLCPFALMGTCNDRDCQFIHQIESQAK